MGGVQRHAYGGMINNRENRLHFLGGRRPWSEEIFEREAKAELGGAIAQSSEGVAVECQETIAFGIRDGLITAARMDDDDTHSYPGGDRDMPLDPLEIFRPLVRVRVRNVSLQKRMRLGRIGVQGGQRFQHRGDCPLEIRRPLQLDQMFRRDFENRRAEGVQFAHGLDEWPIGEEGGPDGRVRIQA